jgi:hypothetical protein
MPDWKIRRCRHRPIQRAQDHERILGDIVRLLGVASADANLDDHALANRLADSSGMNPTVAWRLVTLVPMAFGRAVLQEFDVTLLPTYILRRDNGTESRRGLRDEPEFRAAEDHIDEFRRLPGFRELASRSAEVNALSRLLDSGLRPEGAVLAETVVWESPS